MHTDNSEGTAAQAETMNRGFCLDYVQQPCSVAGWKLQWTFEPLNVVITPKEKKNIKTQNKISWNELVVRTVWHKSACVVQSEKQFIRQEFWNEEYTLCNNNQLPDSIM